MTWELREGHVLDVLAALPARSVHCVVTSPPYHGLRAYGTEPQVWGGAADCEHSWTESTRRGMTGGIGERSPVQGPNNGTKTITAMFDKVHSATCTRCGAWRGELGSEPSVEMFVANLVAVFRAVWRVLRDDGTCWVNLGSSFIGGKIESDEYILRDDLTPEELGYVYAELAKHFAAESAAVSAVRSTAASAEPAVPDVLPGAQGAARPLPDSGV